MGKSNHYLMSQETSSALLILATLFKQTLIQTHSNHCFIDLRHLAWLSDSTNRFFRTSLILTGHVNLLCNYLRVLVLPFFRLHILGLQKSVHNLMLLLLVVLGKNHYYYCSNLGVGKKTLKKPKTNIGFYFSRGSSSGFSPDS